MFKSLFLAITNDFLSQVKKPTRLKIIRFISVPVKEHHSKNTKLLTKIFKPLLSEITNCSTQLQSLGESLLDLVCHKYNLTKL